MKNKPKIQPPDWFCPIAIAYWRQYQPQVAPEDNDLLALLCTSFANYRSAQEEIQERGLTITTKTGVVRPNPATIALKDAHNQIVSILKELKLTPKTKPPEQESDELDEFFAD